MIEDKKEQYKSELGKLRNEMTELGYLDKRKSLQKRTLNQKKKKSK